MRDLLGTVGLGAIAILLLGFAMRGNGVEAVTPENINVLNPDNALDRADAVTVSVSSGNLCWKEKCWPVSANQHTPRGRFKIGKAVRGSEFGIDSPIVLPFLVLPSEQVPKDNPQYDPVNYKYTTWGIHLDNRAPGQLGAGCILVETPEDLAAIGADTQGATLIIEG